MYGQDVEFIVTVGAFFYACLLMFATAEFCMRAARKRRRKH